MPRTSTAKKLKPAAAAPARYVAISDEIARDNTTGLQWTRKKFGSFTFKQAKAHIEQLNAEKHGGHADWRLPTVEELFCLADRSKYSPAIDTAAFPDTKSDWYWSSTQYAPHSGYAWLVGFGSGHSGGGRHGGVNFVRAVRASQ